jgi:hypothetical protein
MATLTHNLPCNGRKASPNGIKLLQEVYVIAIVFAFHKLSEVLHKYVVESFNWWPLDPRLPAVILPSLVVITFGLRFFWCVDLIRRCIDNGLESRAKLAASVAVLMAQAFGVYFLAALLWGFVDTEHQHKPVGVQFLGWSTALVVVNALWLRVVPMDHCDTVSKWVRNNVAFGCVGVAVFVWAWGQPTPPDDSYILALAGAIYFGNSLLDFWENWEHYFFQERQSKDDTRLKNEAAKTTSLACRCGGESEFID